MNKFWVEFTASTTVGEMSAGLAAVPALNQTFEDDTWFFDANWGTSLRDLNNLSGRIETGSGRNSVAAIGLQDDESSSSNTDDSSSSSS